MRLKILRNFIVPSFFLMLAATTWLSDDAQADNGAPNQRKNPPMSLAPETGAAVAGLVVGDEFLKYLHLEIYEAAVGDSSICQKSNFCEEHVRKIKSWVCAADACAGSGGANKPIDCFRAITNQYTMDVQNKINAAICPLIKSPNAQTLNAFMSQLPDGKDDKDELAEYLAYVLALKNSSDSCVDYIKNYVGPYGSAWTIQWFRALSGCQILGNKAKREDEEKDFLSWTKVLMKEGNCSSIVDPRIRQACSTSGVKFPIPQ